MFLETPGRGAPLHPSDLLTFALTEAMDLQTRGSRLRQGSGGRVRVRMMALYPMLRQGFGINQL